MSVKASGAAWDLECPKKYGELEFRPTHKFVLLAYTDHADHYGKNIWPAVKTIAKKTGFDDRTVQRLTNDLVAFGMLVEDGHGPRGTNKFYTPILEEGWQSATPGTVPGDKDKKSLGDIPSGDIPSGDSVPPELKEQNLNNNISIKYIDVWVRVLKTLKDERPRAQFETWIESTELAGFEDGTLIVAARNEYARDWLTNRVAERAQEISGYFVKFVVADFAEEEPA